MEEPRQDRKQAGQPARTGWCPPAYMVLVTACGSVLHRVSGGAGKMVWCGVGWGLAADSTASGRRATQPSTGGACVNGLKWAGGGGGGFWGGRWASGWPSQAPKKGGKSERGWEVGRSGGWERQSDALLSSVGPAAPGFSGGPSFVISITVHFTAMKPINIVATAIPPMLEQATRGRQSVLDC